MFHPIISNLVFMKQESSKMDTLSDHLDNYEKYGIPRPNAILCDNDELERKCATNWKFHNFLKVH
jgi:hypothetical protein